MMGHPQVTELFAHLFVLREPLLEKVLRPILMYTLLIVMLRAFGKRELAQLNPFDLVVLLTLANTVQNAMVGEDTTLIGGVIGAGALLSMNWLLSRAVYRMRRLNSALTGSATTLVKGGTVDSDAMREEALTQEELISVLNRNGFNDPAEVDSCTLEPNGTFYVKGMVPSASMKQGTEMSEALQTLAEEVRALRAELRAQVPPNN